MGTNLGYRVTFKKQPRATGLARVTEHAPYTDVRVNGIEVGSIVPPHYSSADRTWGVVLRVEDASVNCGWRNLRFKARHENEPAAREWIKRRINAIALAHPLYLPAE